MMQHLNIEHLNDATEGGELTSLKNHKSNRPPSEPYKKLFGGKIGKRTQRNDSLAVDATD